MVSWAPSLLRHHATTNEERKHIMAAQASRLKVSKVGVVTQVEFVDRNILDESNIQQIADELAAIVDAVPTPMIMIRFGNVQHLSSAALGALITINNRVKGKDGKLRLAEIDPQIREVFKITKLDKIFQIFDDADDAQNSFG
jgi:anti-sigma B factor antagonist